MSNFLQLVKKHKELLELQNNPTPDFQNRINNFINEVQKSGRNIEDPDVRDLLRSYLRFWSTVSYEMDNTKGYRIVELDEYVGRKTKIRRTLQLFFRLLVAVVIILMVVFTAVFLPLLGIQKISEKATQNSLAMLSPTHLPQTPTVPIIHPTTIIEEQVIPTSMLAFETSITSPQNGEIIYPELDVSGTYRNLPVGTSIHVLIQSLNQGNTIFILPEYVTILPENTSGEWNVKANLENIFNLDEFDTTYILTIGFVQSDETRKILEREGSIGFTTLPEGVFQFNTQPITVTGSKFKYTTAPRLIYTEYDIKNSQMDIFMAHEDGSEILQITNTLDVSETLPAISPDGNSIAFIGKESNPETNESNYSIWSMDVDGNNPIPLFSKDRFDFTDLDWSPDGNALLFTGNYTDNNGNRVKGIYLLSILTNEAKLIELEYGNNWSARWVSNDTFYYLNGNGKTQINAIFQYDFITSQSIQKFVLPEMANDFAIGPENTIAISVWNKESFDLYLLNFQENQLLSLVKNDDGYDLWPCWSSDFKKVYFTTNRDNGNNAIWSVDVASGAQQIVLQPLTYTPDIGMVNAILPEE